jgi:hypothetical protein
MIVSTAASAASLLLNIPVTNVAFDICDLQKIFRLVVNAFKCAYPPIGTSNGHASAKANYIDGNNRD